MSDAPKIKLPPEISASEYLSEVLRLMLRHGVGSLDAGCEIGSPAHPTHMKAEFIITLAKIEDVKTGKVQVFHQ